MGLLTNLVSNGIVEVVLSEESFTLQDGVIRNLGQDAQILGLYVHVLQVHLEEDAEAEDLVLVQVDGGREHALTHCDVSKWLMGSIQNVAMPIYKFICIGNTVV